MKNKIIVILLIIFIILHFLVNHLHFGTVIYSCLVLPFAIYFFPIKPILIFVNQKIEIKPTLFMLFSYFVMSSILSFSTISYFIENDVVKYIYQSFLIFNAILFWVQLFRNDSKYLALFHFLIMFFYYF